MTANDAGNAQLHAAYAAYDKMIEAKRAAIPAGAPAPWSKWDHRFIALAKHIATWSPCVRRQVGAVIVRDKHVLATGYNGPPRGAPHRTAETCVRIGIPSGERADVVCCAHAEANAIAQAAYHGVSVRGATLYCTTAPCAWCARTIINAGLILVVYAEGYPDPLAAQVYTESAVVMEQLT